MQFGFATLHPVTLPIGNELAFVIGSIASYIVVAYIGLIKPELTQILDVLDAL